MTRRPLRDEAGYSIVIVLALLVIGVGLGAAALAGVLASRSHANRDSRSRRALQAADAGIQSVLWTQNQLNLPSLDWNAGPAGLSQRLDCVVPAFDMQLKVTGLATASVNSAGVCPTGSGAGAPGNGLTAGFPVGDHAAYKVQYLPGTTAQGSGGVGRTTMNPKIVALGYDDGGDTSNTAGYVARRVEAVLAPIDPLQAVEAQGDLTFNGLLGLAAVLNGNARTNGDFTAPPVFANTDLAGGLIGSVTYGGSISSGVNIAHKVRAAGSVNRPPVSIASSKPNCSMAANCTALGPAYDPVKDTFSLSSGSVTFQPGDYVFCNFNVTGGTVTAAATAAAPVRIFIDSPKSSRCSGNGLGSAQGNLVAKTGINNLLSSLPNATGASGLQLYVVGTQNSSPVYDNGTTAEIDGSFGVIQSFVLYAPTSRVTVTAGCSLVLCTALQGAVIGDSVTINATLFTQDLNLSGYPLYPGLGAFHVQQYVECPVPSPASDLPSPDPTSGC